MAIADRRQREKEQRRTEILDTAERLFFSRGYDDVSMDEIANEVELNKATIYLYFRNKEALLSEVVLRGLTILLRKYTECGETQVPGLTKVLLMGKAYYRFTREHPDYERMIRYYGIERFSEDNPCSAEIQTVFNKSRTILKDAIQAGIDDGTIRGDIHPLKMSLYLMISLMGIMAHEHKWDRVIEADGISHDEFVLDFFRFLMPAISSGEKPHTISLNEAGGPFGSLFFSVEPVVVDPKKKKK